MARMTLTWCRAKVAAARCARVLLQSVWVDEGKKQKANRFCDRLQDLAMMLI
jgi:hypothetical protein